MLLRRRGFHCHEFCSRVSVGVGSGVGIGKSRPGKRAGVPRKFKRFVGSEDLFRRPVVMLMLVMMIIIVFLFLFFVFFLS